jgi:hypothetical protein
MSDLIKSATAAIRAGDAAELRRLLGRDPKLVNQSGPGMLKYAVEADRVEVLAVLVEAGADVNAPTSSDTPLTAAARRGSLAAVAWPLDTRRGLAALGEKNRVLFLVGYLVDQVADGGVAGFYANPSAEYAPQLPAALDAIGATAAAAAVRDLNALFPGGAPAADDQTRWRQLEQLGKQLSKRGAALERLVDERAGKRGGSLLLKQLYGYYHAGGTEPRAPCGRRVELQSFRRGYATGRRGWLGFERVVAGGGTGSWCKAATAAALGAARRRGTRRTEPAIPTPSGASPACGGNDGPRSGPLARRAKGSSIAPAAAGERSERKPGRTWRAAAPPL